MRVVIIIVLMLSINCFAIHDVKMPTLVFVGKRIVNLGVVKEGEIIKQNFFFTNTGNSPLIIKDITKSCNCTAVVLKEPRTLPRDNLCIYNRLLLNIL